jgi:hypothetical protein
MSPDQLREGLEELGWTLHEASVQLGVRAGAPRVGDWTSGRRSIPPYIAASVRAHLELRRCREGKE